MKPTNSHSAGGIVIGPQGHILIVNQRHSSWSLPKGHLEPNESPQDAARREIAEETGVTTLTYLGELGTYTRYKISKTGGQDPLELKKLTFFAYTTPTLHLAPTDPDNPIALWLPPQEIQSKLTHTKDKAFVQENLPKALALACAILHTTYPTQADAQHAQAQLLTQKLAACIHLQGPITSSYHWQNTPETTPEWSLSITHFRPHLPQIIALIKSTHPYTLPQLLTTPILNGDLDYLSWIISPK